MATVHVCDRCGNIGPVRQCDAVFIVHCDDGQSVEANARGDMCESCRTKIADDIQRKTFKLEADIELRPDRRSG